MFEYPKLDTGATGRLDYGGPVSPHAGGPPADGRLERSLTDQHWRTDGNVDGNPADR
jgi:hypothetical protein